MVNIKMLLKPISRDSMHLLKSEADEKIRIQRLNNIIENIYRGAVNTARTSSETSFKQCYSNNKFYETNMFEIISTLQSLFPDCSVKNTCMIIGKDGKFYDMSKMDEMFLNYIRGSRNTMKNEYIVIDWSKE
jgi:hypothetical protein